MGLSTTEASLNSSIMCCPARSAGHCGSAEAAVKCLCGELLGWLESKLLCEFIFFPVYEHIFLKGMLSH